MKNMLKVSRQCKECGEDFSTDHPSKKYCSNYCRDRKYRRTTKNDRVVPNLHDFLLDVGSSDTTVVRDGFNVWMNSVGLQSLKPSVYRMYSENHLIYVGITGDLQTRMWGHYKSTPWILEVDRVETDEFDAYWLAELAERIAISLFDPVHNKSKLAFSFL